MATLQEIESAVLHLSAEEKQRLLLRLAQNLRAEGTLPQPRRFSTAEIQGWIEEDERDMEAFRRKA
jgi:hypothetical protein